MSSGLYDELTSNGLLINHKEVKNVNSDAWKTLLPDQIPFISYFYEWSFSMLKDAALTTLAIQKIALKHNMSLKDASAFNIQFVKGRPILIDTLSFEKYEEGKPWVAYKQFVEHFLAPLALASIVDVRFNRMGQVFHDGIPVDLAAAILPFKTKLNLGLFIHIHAHASNSKKFSDKKLDSNIKSKRFTKTALLGLIDNLEKTIQKMTWKPEGTEWEDYYEEDKNNYKSESMKHKGDLTRKFVKEAGAKTVWDMGANTGYFSRIAAETGAEVNAFDIDFGAIEKAYLDIKESGEEKILPLFSDLTNPTPSLGWNLEERDSLFERGPADAVLALAIIHHLAISKNMPFDYLAECFAKLGKYLVIEFVDKKDSQVQILLSTRKDIFPNYTLEDFEKTFSKYFTVVRKEKVKNSLRTLFLMKRK